MQTRFYRPDDLSQIERLYQAQGFAFEMPDFSGDPLWHIKLVGEQDGKIVNAAFAHLTAEVYGFFDQKAGTPRERYRNFLALHEAGCEIAYRTGGLSDLHAWLPPQIEKSFGRRLMKLGWKRPLWTCYAKDLGR